MTRVILLQAINGVSFGMLLFLVSSGLSVIYGLMRVVNLAHGSLYILGGYVTLSIISAGYDFWIAALAGGAVAAILGLVIERLLMFRGRADETQEILLTFGILLVVREAVRTVWGTSPEMLPEPDWPSGSIQLGSIVYPSFRAFLIPLGLALAGVMWWLERKTRVGALLRASVEDSKTAGVMGINVPALFVGTFCVGGFLAGVSGALGGTFSGVYPGADLQILVLAFVVVIIGGAGNIMGAFWGGLLVGVIDSFGRLFFPQLALFIVFIPMLVVLIFRSNQLVRR